MKDLPPIFIGPTRVEVKCPWNACIYCGSDGGEDGLRMEHPLPRSLGGSLEIMGASCRDCEDITKKLDAFLANVLFRELRISHRIPSRRKTTSIESLPFTYRLNDGEEKTEEVRIEERPFQAFFPQFARAGVLAGREAETAFQGRGLYTYLWVPKAFEQKLEMGLDDEVAIGRKRLEIDLRTFSRAIAKIAHGFAVAYRPEPAFSETHLTKLIRGEYPHPSFIVGCESETPSPSASDCHVISFDKVPAGPYVFATCSVRLFAFCKDRESGLGPPAYQVVLGNITDIVSS